MSYFLTKYKKDVFFLSLLSFIVAIFAIIFFQKQGLLMVDCGREPYLAKEVMMGKILYKELLNIYGPLSYQINAILFKLFGVHLNTLFVAGNIIAYGIILSIYFISRLFTQEFLSFSLAFFTAVMGIANVYLFNFVFPYTFAMTYALLAILLSLFCLLKHYQTSKRHFIVLSFFFMGFSITSKLDFAGCLIVLLVYSLFIKKCTLKGHFYNALAFLSLPLLAFGTLFLQGLSLQDIPIMYDLYTKIITSEGSQTFLKSILGIYSPINWTTILNLAITNLILLLFLCILYKISLKTHSKVILGVLLLIMQISINAVVSPYSFIYIVILIFSLLLLLVAKNIIKLTPINDTDLSLILLFSFSILMSIRNFSLIVLHIAYGLYPLPILLLCLVVFIAIYAPAYIHLKNKNIFINSLAILVIIISNKFLIHNFVLANFVKNSKISTSMGSIYVTKKEFDKYQNMLVSCSKIPKGNKLLVLPQGVMINFLLDKESDPFYFVLIPPYIEAFGEDKIINDLKNNPKTSFLITGIPTLGYGKIDLCVDHGQKLCKYIQSRNANKH